MFFFFPFEKAAVKEQPSRGQHLLSSAPDFFETLFHCPPVCQMREEDLSQMKHEAAKQTRLKETNQRKLRLMEEQKADMETQKEMLKAHISALEKGTRDMNSYHFLIPSACT